MKRMLRGLLAAILIGALSGLALAWARPGWLPSGLRAEVVQLKGWLGEGEDSAADEGKNPDESRPAGKPPEMIDDGWCEARSKFKGMGDERSAKECPRLLPVIRLAAPGIARRIGLETAEVVAERRARHLAANAETAYDAQRMAEVIPRVGGVLKEVRADLGQVVHRGEVLAVVDSAQVGASKASFLTARAAADLARVTHDRTVKLTQAKAAPGKTEMESLTALTRAETDLRDAEQRLRNLGFNDAELERIATSKDTKNLLDVVAPIDGTITTWDATLGEAVEPTTQLFGLADMRRMWVWIDVYEADVIAVRPGQPVAFVISGTEQPVFEGRVTWMGTEVSPMTRTTRVRAELPNPDGRLRANQFGRARIRVEESHEAVVVPRSAVQHLNGVDFVFVARGDGSYRPQRILTRRAEDDDPVEVAWGLETGLKVVTTRSYTLKSEMLRDRLGASDND
jgi:cobalt-zinc-cadmium efflux system membrane fusion protein